MECKVTLIIGTMEEFQFLYKETTVCSYLNYSFPLSKQSFEPSRLNCRKLDKCLLHLFILSLRFLLKMIVLRKRCL